MPLLEIKNLSKRFGGLQAVKDVSFTVPQGSIKAVIGPNGAGKTTLFNLVSGFLAPDSGTIKFQNEHVQGRTPHRIAGLGMSRTFQHIRLFSHMNVLENVMVGAHNKGRAGFVAGMVRSPRMRREEHDLTKRAYDVMDLLGIAGFAEDEATSLSYGQQRIVELARALAGGPEMLLLDEPAAGLNMRETADMADMILRVRDRGITVLIVEHDMQLVMKISDEVAVLSYGQKIADSTPHAVQQDPEVVRVYLGEDDA
jgi:branched-chain amino acid transport system ATP-binding protein